MDNKVISGGIANETEGKVITLKQEQSSLEIQSGEDKKNAGIPGGHQLNFN